MVLRPEKCAESKNGELAHAHADSTIKADGFTIEHGIADDGLNELREFGGFTKSCGVRNLRA